jgi:hypothetical protein
MRQLLILLSVLTIASCEYGYVIKGNSDFVNAVKYFLIESDGLSMYSLQNIDDVSVMLFSTSHTDFSKPINILKTNIINSPICTYYVSLNCGEYLLHFEDGITHNINTFRFLVPIEKPLRRNSIFIETPCGTEKPYVCNQRHVGNYFSIV